MADNDYIGEIQNQRLNQQWSNSMQWSTPSWMQAGFKQGPRVSQAPRFRPPSIGMRLNWGANEQIMDRGFNKGGEKWSNRYKDKSTPDSSTTGTPLPSPTSGTAVTGPTAPATPTTPTASGTMPAPSSSSMTMASFGGARSFGQTMGQVRNRIGAIRNTRANRRSSGTVI